MTHDPLCPTIPTGFDTRCQCELIAAVREDMLAKCIAAVEVVPALAQHVDDNGMVSLVYDKGDALDALRALQEVDTPKQEPIKHINFITKSAR